MYNRYIPQGDGSYRKNRVGEPSRPGARPEPTPPLPQHPADAPSKLPQSAPAYPPCPEPGFQPPDPVGMRQFLRRLLPNGFDTEDLIVVLLLLLISGGEEKNHALLTLAIYLFL